MTQENGSGGAEKKIWMTLTGLPLTIRLEWPFHKSTSGADFWVLHGDIRLENSEGLHAAVAVNLSMTVREVMPSLEPKDAEAPVINALRKEVDRRQIEFVKSGKLLPVAFSSRHYDFKRQQWVFGKAGDEVMAEFLARKVYWETRGEWSPTLRRKREGWVTRGVAGLDLLILRRRSICRLLPSICWRSRGVAADGLIRMDGEFAEATAGAHGAGGEI